MNHVLTVQPNDMIPNLCCAYHSVMELTKETIDSTCNKSSEESKGSGEYFVSLIGMALNDPIELICGAYSSYGICQQRIPEQMAAIENATRWELTEEFISTPVVPILKVVEKLDSDINL